MRSSENEKDTVSALYEDDVDSSVLISCGACGCPQIDTSAIDEPCFCESCGVELFYRPWYEW